MSFRSESTALPASGAGAGTYAYPSSVSVDAQGRVSSALSGGVGVTYAPTSTVPDGATAVAFSFNGTLLANVTAKIASFQSIGVEKVAVMSDGSIFGAGANQKYYNNSNDGVNISSAHVNFILGNASKVSVNVNGLYSAAGAGLMDVGVAGFEFGTGRFGTLTAAAAGALTITSPVSATWSVASGTLALDGTAVNIGATAATTVQVGRATAQTSIPSGLVLNNRVTVNDIDYAANAYDCIIEYTAISANRTVTLPNASAGNTGQIYIIKKNTNSAAFKVLVTTVGGAQLIEGATTFTPGTASPWASGMFYSFGTGYAMIADKNML